MKEFHKKNKMTIKSQKFNRNKFNRKFQSF
jgi:hypothetical protein